MITCPNCARENADNFNFCLDCGFDLKTHHEALKAAPPASEPEPAAPIHTESLGREELSAVTGTPLSSPEPRGPELGAPKGGHGDVVDLSAPATAPSPIVVSSAPPADLSSMPDQPTQTGESRLPSPSTMPPSAAAAAERPCPSCNAPVPAAMKFCGNCGKRLDGGGEAPAPASGARTMFMHAADLAAVQEKVCRLITIDQSGKEGMTFTIKQGDTLCGRVNGIILFFDDPFVSPTHCLFTFQGGKLTVTDKGSLNGLYLRLKTEQALIDGDLLRIGRQLFRFELLSQSGAQVKRVDGDDAQIWGSPAPEAFGRLVQILEDGRTGEIRMLEGDSCQLGREQGQIVFPTDGFVSGRHCVFLRQDEQAVLKDLGSSNGTYVRVRERAEISHGDFLLIGNQMMRVEIL